MSSLPGNTNRVSWRGILIGLLLIPINTYWITITEMAWSYQFTSASLPLNVIFILLILVLLNWLIKFVAPNSVLSSGELLTIYIILASSSALSGFDSMVALMGTIPHAFWYNTPENDWASLFHNNIPRWLVVSDKRVIRGFYRGEESFFTARNIDSWITPILSWSAFIIILVFIMLLINVIIRKRWTEQEKLTYPIIQLPLEMASEKSRFFRNRLMWIGFSVAAFIDILAGINFLYPSVPYIPTRGFSLESVFTDKPFNAIGFSPMRFRPFIIGLTYLLPWDLSFSCWFFHLSHKSFRIWSSAVGWSSIPGFPFFGEHSLGAMVALSIIALVNSRKYLANILRKIFTGKGEDDSHEPLSYRQAFVGIIIASFVLFVFCAKAGMSPWVFLLFFALYFAISFSITRIRAELGIPEHAFSAITPQAAMTTVLGTRRLRKHNLTLMAIFLWFTRRKRSHPMPHQLEAFKIAERTGMSNRGVFWVTLAASAVGVAVTFAMFSRAVYIDGAETRGGIMITSGSDAFDSLSSWLYHPRGPNFLGSIATAAGAIFTLLLAFMRRKFIWWVFHPTGYVLGMGGAVNEYWFTMVISSTIKLIVLRSGGVRAYRKSIPFFLGLVLGEYFVAYGWALLGVIVGKPMYVVWI